MENKEFETFKCSSCVKESYETVNIERFIDKLDRFFSTNNKEGAYKHLMYWEDEAKRIGDYRALLSIFNEEIGFSRRTDDKELAFKAIDGAKSILINYDFEETPRIGVIYINMATTYSCFDCPDKAIELYSKAKDIYTKNNLKEKYEYAALLNNEATTLSKLKRFDEAINNINEAINILLKEGLHDGEIAVSFVNLAHIYNDRNIDDVDLINECLDKAWEFINSKRERHDQNYAFILSKVAPSFKFFNRTIEAQALEEISDEIYGG